MSSNIKIVNWENIAGSDFTWLGDLWYPTSSDLWKIAGLSGLGMITQWIVWFEVGEPGYSDYVNCFIRVRFLNYWGVQVWDSGKHPCWITNGKTYEFDCVTMILTEVSVSGPTATIIDKQLRYDSTVANIPVSSVPIDSYGSVYITAKNNGDSPILLGINLTVKRPDGSVALSTSDQSDYVYAGESYLFAGYAAVNLYVSGAWTIQITLFQWNGSEWVNVDSWQGNLCTVQSEIPTGHTFSSLNVVYNKI